MPARHWFSLGRPLTRDGGGIALMSWNGSMFEYLMAPLFLRSGPETLLAESERTSVAMQRRYGDRLGIPWGISESAFSNRDPQHRYRYQAFGVPGLGLKRGLEKDLVVAPYASALALAVEPAEATANLRRLWSMGTGGLYGLFDAVDFTPERLPPRQPFVPGRAYMAHHQGMLLSAIGNALCGDALIDRVAGDGRIRVADLLLSERIPHELPSEIERIAPREAPPRAGPAARAPYAWPAPAADLFPQVHLLGNGRLASWISEAGGGGLHWRHHALTRFVPDATSDSDGLFIYVRDEEDGALWSATRQPTAAAPQEYRVTFHPHMAEFHRRDHGISMRTEIGVAPSDDVEIRRITLVNETPRRRVLSLTSYGEVVLAPPLDDERHPAFSKLFVGSEFRPDLDALLFNRRPRHPHETPPALLHRVIGDGGAMTLAGHESDRRAFLGRGGTPRRAAAAIGDLSGTTGWTLDPILALRARIELAAHETRQLCFLTIAGGSAEAVLETADRYASLASIDWAIEDAVGAAAREARELRLDPDRLPELQQLASLLIHPHAALRAAPDLLRGNHGGQPLLWGLGISGDLPILLCRAGGEEQDGLELIRDLVLAHRLWLRRGLAADLVILKSSASAYVEPARERLLELLGEHGAHEYLGRRGGIHLASSDQMVPETLTALEAAARVLLDTGRGSLSRQLAEIAAPPRDIPRLEPSAMPSARHETTPLPRAKGLLFDNGLGGFAPGAREYVIHVEPGRATPAPWINVLANPLFGSIVSESGAAFSWAANSGENRLTPWSNDPVTDRPGEMLYLRDEEDAAVWTPTPFAASSACEVRHGAGRTFWRQRSHGLEQEVVAFAPPEDPVKLVRLTLRNAAARPRRITATYYAEWLLGSMRSLSRPSVVAEYDPGCRAILSRNPWNPERGERTAFLTCDRPAHGLTGSRAEFLGREGDPTSPEALRRWGLSSTVEPADDACAAWQVHLDLAAGEEKAVVFALGEGSDRHAAEILATRWQESPRLSGALAATEAGWDRLLDAISVRTPDPAFDAIVNRWLTYQTIASRLLARAGFYQASGAFGFRDQLQDLLALLHIEPGRLRDHILLCCAHQFEEGDVLHWWHAPEERGVRTRCSDDLLWLPYAAAQYVEATGDHALLDEQVAFLRAPPLGPEEGDRYAHYPPGSGETASVFEHCARALDRGLTRGAHGLPLIGSGDWNDGMDRVGRSGRGESVWLAWFAIVTAEAFLPLARARDDARTGEWSDATSRYRLAAETEAWDGEWYRRAFDDQGEPLGSAGSDECRIDSISQSWAAFAGADLERVRRALDSAWRELVDEETGIVRLLAPPFQHTPRDPGYIKAYPPGVRENGGQYTHAAAWLGLAFASLGDGERAYRIFELLNPVRHADSPDRAALYRIEPYVVAGDVAAEASCRGRGGWSWYSGSAAWLWRLGIEGIVGLRITAEGITLRPCTPAAWPEFEIALNLNGGKLRVRVENPGESAGNARTVLLDGREIVEPIPLPRAGEERELVIRFGKPVQLEAGLAIR